MQGRKGEGDGNDNGVEGTHQPASLPRGGRGIGRAAGQRQCRGTQGPGRRRDHGHPLPAVPATNGQPGGPLWAGCQAGDHRPGRRQAVTRVGLQRPDAGTDLPRPARRYGPDHPQQPAVGADHHPLARDARHPRERRPPDLCDRTGRQLSLLVPDQPASGAQLVPPPPPHAHRRAGRARAGRRVHHQRRRGGRARAARRRLRGPAGGPRRQPRQHRQPAVQAQDRRLPRRHRAGQRHP